MSFRLEKIEKQNSQISSDKLIKNGFLYVKLPTNLRGIVGYWKAWNRKWIEINFQNFNVDKNNISITVSVFRNEKLGTNGLKIPIYQQNFQSQNAVIFRCKSRTHAYAFTICKNDLPAIHLSGSSEIDSQLWMQSLRNSLWPPNPLMELENSMKGHFYISIIDNENSHKAGLLGAYGYLQVSAYKIILTHPQTGHVIQEWHLSSFTLKNQFKNILQITKKSNTSGIGNIFFYCNDAKEVIERINKEKELIKDSMEYGFRDSFKNNTNFFPKIINDFQNLNSNIEIISSDISVNNTFRIRTAKEIPEIMLNCSFSSPNSLLTNKISNNENSENIYSEPLDLFSNEDLMSEEMYEEIYEEIAFKECEEYPDDCCGKGLDVKKTKVEDDLPPELPPKRIISNPILIINNNHNYKCLKPGQLKSFSLKSDEIANYDMFSAIVRQTNIPLLNRQNLLKISNGLEENIENQMVNDYCEMRPISISMRLAEKHHLSDSSDYVDMRSFSV